MYVLLYLKCINQSCPTLHDSMDCSLPGSSVHAVIQKYWIGWVTNPFSRGIFPNQGLKLDLLHCRWILYCLSHQRSSRTLQVRLLLKTYYSQTLTVIFFSLQLIYFQIFLNIFSFMFPPVE